MYMKVRIFFLVLAAMLIGIIFAEASQSPGCTLRLDQSSDAARTPGPTPPASSMRCS